ncbi:UDP-3-O-(3-hydroxymyristoyl)glucosamine N-acyltransferase [Desulfococcaceae bacterium HSG7]|nr:UDP-3-O-(3-hydroxymyristoyl)glucosamine N-acyltransferase [Desulfococcaceae bacterium HSG7]
MEISLADIAQKVDGELRGDSQKLISNAAPFELAKPEDITFAGSRKFIKKLNLTKAGAVFIPASGLSEDVLAASQNLIIVDHPQVAFARILNTFYPPSKPASGVSPTATIGENFTNGKDVSIGHCVVIGDDVKIGSRVCLHPHVVIEDQVVIGDDTEIFPHVTIHRYSKIGANVIIQAGSVIGSDGFGYASDGNKYIKIPHTGIVQIDDDVEIGACNTIDRATFGKTWIQQGVKTDNLVHIAHNVTVGANTVSAAQVGVSGSTTIGRNVILAGQVGISEHLTIGDGAILGPQAGIAQAVDKGQVVSGSPEMPHRLWLRVQRIIPRLPLIRKKLSTIEKKVNKIEKKLGLSPD